MQLADYTLPLRGRGGRQWWWWWWRRRRTGVVCTYQYPKKSTHISFSLPRPNLVCAVPVSYMHVVTNVSPDVINERTSEFGTDEIASSSRLSPLSRHTMTHQTALFRSDTKSLGNRSHSVPLQRLEKASASIPAHDRQALRNANTRQHNRM